MHDASGGITASRHRVVQGVHRETGFHSVRDRVADDPAGEHVFDGAEVELALVGPVLGDVGQPEFVDVVCGEVALHEVVVDRRSGALPVLAALLPEHGPPLVVAADPPRGPLAHRLARFCGFADQETVAVFGVVDVGVQ